jgi:hypothetical protein
LDLKGANHQVSVKADVMVEHYILVGEQDLENGLGTDLTPTSCRRYIKQENALNETFITEEIVKFQHFKTNLALPKVKMERNMKGRRVNWRILSLEQTMN